MDIPSNNLKSSYDQSLLHDLQMRRERLLAKIDDKPPISPWIVICGGLFSGALIALVVIDFTLRTLSLHHG